jgi:hypothetical protein
MKSTGIRIRDRKKGGGISVQLSDILKEIYEGDLFFWSILYLRAIGHLGDGKSLPEFQKQIGNSENGLFITWKDLNILAQKLYQIHDVVIIGCRDIRFLKTYDTDQEMYETCDIYIEMVDSGYWEVFSKDDSLIARLAAKFKDIKFLEPDFNK